MSGPLSRVPFRWLEPTFPYLCVLGVAMGTLVDKGGCYSNGEIKNWLVFRQSLCHVSDGMGLGWVYETANVFSSYLQKAVAEMSNQVREAGGIVMDFTKIPEAHLKKVVKLLGKSQGSFLLKEVSKPMNNVILRTLSRATVSSLYSSMMSSTPKDPNSQKQLPICKVCLMIPWSRRFSKTRLLVTKNNGSPMCGLSLSSLS